MIFSTNLSFIPVDVEFGPRGDLYICDWYNPVKGHMQYSLRDDAARSHVRPHLARRAEGREASRRTGDCGRADSGAARTVEVAAVSHPRSREARTRGARPRRGRETARRLGARARSARTRVSGIIRSRRSGRIATIGATNHALFREVLACEEPLARAAATQQLRHWHAQLPDAIESVARARERRRAGSCAWRRSIAASYIGTRGRARRDSRRAGDVRRIRISPMRCARHWIRRRCARFWKGNQDYLAAHPQIAAFQRRQETIASSRQEERPDEPEPHRAGVRSPAQPAHGSHRQRAGANAVRREKIRR